MIHPRIRGQEPERARAIADALARQGLPPKAAPGAGDLVAGRVAVHLAGPGWRATALTALQLAARVRAAAQQGLAPLVVWHHFIHPFDPEAIAREVRRLDRRSEPGGRYRVIWADGTPVTSGRLDDAQLELMPPSVPGAHPLTNHGRREGRP